MKLGILNFILFGGGKWGFWGDEKYKKKCTNFIYFWKCIFFKW